MKSGFNLSEWSLRHPALVLYAMLTLTLVGMLSYTRLGQSEDPPFTFKVMVIRTGWPGASAQEVEQQVTDKLEKKLQEVPWLDNLRSYSRPGESLIFLSAKDSTPADQVPDIFYQARKKVGDIAYTLPNGIEGPTFNDEFGDVYGNLYALTGDGYDYAELKRHAETVRAELLRMNDVAKVDFFGEQKQRIYVELSNAKLATIGVDIATLLRTLQAQNLVTGSGSFDSENEHIRIAVTGRYDRLEELRDVRFRANNNEFRLGDVAKISRGFEDPPKDRVRYKGRDALLIGVSMRAGGDIIKLGRDLDQAVTTTQAQLPVGLELHTVSSQPKAVQRSVNEFAKALTEAVVIVLGVSLLSLGLRTGIVVAITIPVVLAVTFWLMHLFGVGLHKISLGALILALGLLVDDAIIAVEMMASKMEQGWDRTRAAAFAYTSTAMPMLSGTLVTAAGFLPIATAESSTGEYTRSIFQVVVIALLVSWFAAVVFVPYLGYRLLPDLSKGQEQESGWTRFWARLLKKPQSEQPKQHAHDLYQTPFYLRFRKLVAACVVHRWLVIFLTIAMFVTAIFGFKFVQQQFFPDSTRPELIVDLRLAEGVSYVATEADVKKLEAWLDKQSGIDNYVAYVGNGSPRFYLPLDQQLPQRSFAQFVILTNGPTEREQLRDKLIQLFEQDFPDMRGSVLRLENGPPVGFPVQFRVSGPDLLTLRTIAHQVADVMRANPYPSNVQLDWEEPVKVVRVNVEQSKARLLGISSSDIANIVNGALQGLYVTEFREGIERIDLLVRGAEAERKHLSRLQNLMIPIPGGRSVPLSQVAELDYGFEEGLIWRRNRVPTVTVRANLYGNMQAPMVSAQIEEQLADIKRQLPPGYRLETGGAVEESAKGGDSVAAGMPLFFLTVLTVLMIQLQSFSRMALVLLTAPLGLIGVTLFLLIFQQPFGFVAMLGTIALSGMIMRNSVILVDQIDQDKLAGRSDFDAIVDSTVRRFRPIVLTAAAAILAMIPLTHSAFFGPMAVAIMGGLTVATVLTLLFLPALYAAWFRIAV
ncbi:MULTISPECIES: efflux RND transporter permease subunit [Methylomonas]|uniref:Multidrug transporter AcrB n=2 Tax=Methylomonas TaxID=416 RepID=A0A126T4E8_9GAMM|nr:MULTISPECIES: efflux RND transporter permease subunit [Methylomonas]AMK76963.1 multidrug transporter AcrB [Methylomonas denitrificans]OAH97992.1 multidrug transporter AcrB [Methylomonas methanica]TCV81142.1 multidrug efflux pump [Methylomonas methanica]